MADTIRRLRAEVKVSYFSQWCNQQLEEHGFGWTVNAQEWSEEYDADTERMIAKGE